MMASKRSHFSRLMELHRLYTLMLRYEHEGRWRSVDRTVVTIARQKARIRHKWPKGHAPTPNDFMQDVVPGFRFPTHYIEIPPEVLAQMEGIDALIEPRIAVMDMPLQAQSKV